MRIKIAFVPLTDAATLVVAREHGFFERFGLDVELVREQSWASVRDKLQSGRVDAAQMLASMPLALAAGAAHSRLDLVTGLVLGLNGNAITVSNDLYADLMATGLLHEGRPKTTGHALKAVIDRRRSLGRPRLCFASVFRSSTHYFLLRYWMAAAGIDSEKDVRFVVIPPPRMVESLQSGLIDGCCVGEPWNHAAVREFAGKLLLTGHDIWVNAAEKVLAVREDWLEDNAAVYARLCRALMLSAAWCDEEDHRAEVARILAQPDVLDVPVNTVMPSLLGCVCDAHQEVLRRLPDFHVFHRYGAGLPWPSQAQWLLRQMIRWKQVPPGLCVESTANAVFRQDFYLDAAHELGFSDPTQSSRSTGTVGMPHDGLGIQAVQANLTPISNRPNTS